MRPTVAALLALFAIACGSVTLSFVLALRAFFGLLALEPAHRFLLDDMSRWIHVGHLQVLTSRFDPEEVLRKIARYRVTNTHLVATMFHRLLALPDEVKRRYDLSSIRKILHAAAPCPIDVKRRILEVFPPGSVWELYGASEGGGSA